jgi:hypothetical protein
MRRETRPSSLSLLAIVAACGPGLAGCFDVWGTYDTGSTGGSASTTSDSDTGGRGGATSTGPSAEDCQNGEDDDADGLVDCADADCSASGFACTDLVAPDASWSGPVLLHERGSEPTCPWYAPTAVTQREVAAPCACRCGDASGEACLASVQLHNNAVCTSQTASGSIGTACGPISGTASSAAATTTAVGGSCTGSIAGGPDAATDPTRVGCTEPVGAGCGQGEVCARAGEHGEQVCYVKSGDVPCPSDLPLRTVLYDPSTPPACTAPGPGCTCGEQVGSTCSATITLYDTASCSGGVVATFAADGQCAAASSAVASAIATNAAFDHGTCTPNPIDLTGALGQDARTYCCAASL